MTTGVRQAFDISRGGSDRIVLTPTRSEQSMNLESQPQQQEATGNAKAAIPGRLIYRPYFAHAQAA
jgi:hypothetical protein